MKKTAFIILGLIILSSGLFAQSSTEKRFLISVAWSPKLYFDRVSDKSLLIDYSLAGTSLVGEYLLNQRFSIYSGFQFDHKKNAEPILVIYDPPLNDGYSIQIDRITSIPIGLKYTFINLDKNISLYSRGGLKYTRVLNQKRQFPLYDRPMGRSTGVDNILMINLGIGSSVKINNCITPFFEVEYAHSLVGDNSGVSILYTNVGLNFAF